MPLQLCPPVSRKWTHRELNPDLQSAELASSPWTMSPRGQAGDCRPEAGGSFKFKSSSSLQPTAYGLRKVDRRGIEPRLPGCKPGVFPLDQRPALLGWRTRRFRGFLQPLVYGLKPPRVIPDGIEPSLSWVSSRCLRHWTTGPLEGVRFQASGSMAEVERVSHFICSLRPAASSSD